MADGATANYDFVLPEDGGSEDTWGVKLNQNWEDVDGIIHGIATSLSALSSTVGDLDSDDIDNASGVSGNSVSDALDELDSAKADASAVAANTVARTGETGSAVIPAGTEAQRDGSPVVGYLRANTDDGQMEWYDGDGWVPVSPDIPRIPDPTDPEGDVAGTVTGEDLALASPRGVPDVFIISEIFLGDNPGQLPLDTVLRNVRGASLDNDTVTLPAGDYYIEARTTVQNFSTSSNRDYALRLRRGSDNVVSDYTVAGFSRQNTPLFVSAIVEGGADFSLHFDRSGSISTGHNMPRFGADPGLEVSVAFKAWRFA